jgi:hypothetical protein
MFPFASDQMPTGETGPAYKVETKGAVSFEMAFPKKDNNTVRTKKSFIVSNSMIEFI